MMANNRKWALWYVGIMVFTICFMFTITHYEYRVFVKGSCYSWGRDNLIYKDWVIGSCYETRQQAELKLKDYLTRKNAHKEAREGWE